MAKTIWPVSGSITSNIAPRGERMHKGIDIGAPIGTPVIAAASGTASKRSDPDGYGNYIVVDHGGGYETVYAHLSRYAVNDKQRVQQGQTIGYVGNTGSSTGPHLHFEIKLKGTYRDWDAQYHKGAAVSAGNAIHADLPGFPSSPGAPGGGGEAPNPTLRRGSSGPAVKTLQSTLNQFGYALNVDGHFGPATAQAVEAFQKSRGLDPDGVVGPHTWAALQSSEPTRPTLKKGANGAAVRELQAALNRFGYGLELDGDFGPATDRAVRAFQDSHQLQVDGVVGPATWSKLG